MLLGYFFCWHWIVKYAIYIYIFFFSLSNSVVVLPVQALQHICHGSCFLHSLSWWGWTECLSQWCLLCKGPWKCSLTHGKCPTVTRKRRFLKREVICAVCFTAGVHYCTCDFPDAGLWLSTDGSNRDLPLVSGSSSMLQEQSSGQLLQSARTATRTRQRYVYKSVEFISS